MWFLIGVVIVVLASAGLAWWRGSSGWRGDIRVGGCQAKASSHKGKLQQVEVGASTASRLQFDLKPESWLDRLAKNLGLSVEGELGHAAFDQELYLIADDPHVVASLRRDRAIADKLLALFDLRGPGVVKVKRVTCRDGCLRVTLKTKADDDEATAIAGNVAATLRDTALALGETMGGTVRPDPLRWRSTLLVSIAGGLALNGAVQLLRIFVVALPDTLDDGALMRTAVPVGLAGLGALVGATLWLLGRTSRAHLVLLEVLLLGGFGAIATAAAELRDFNIEADGSVARTYDSEVGSRREHRGRRGRRSWSVTLAAWPGSDGPVDFKVSSSEYAAMSPGTPVAVFVHDGALGWEWFERYERVRR